MTFVESASCWSGHWDSSLDDKLECHQRVPLVLAVCFKVAYVRCPVRASKPIVKVFRMYTHSQKKMSVRFYVFLAFIAIFVYSPALASEVSNVILHADTLRSEGNFQESLMELGRAFQRAETDAERGVILGKQAEILAFDLHDYSSARGLVKQSLQQPHAGPVSEVIALRVRAHCEMQGDQDFSAGKKTLLAALNLPDVQWAKSSIKVMLGDCYRNLGDPAEALRSFEEVAREDSVDGLLRATAFLNCGLTCFYDLKQPEKSKKFFAEAVRLNPLLAEEVRAHLEGVPSPSKAMFLAHYMPWYESPPRSKDWGWHWTMNYFDPQEQNNGRREIASQFYPIIGPYDSGDLAVIEYHLLLMKLAGIDGVVVDWYGRADCYDYKKLHENVVLLVNMVEKYQMKFLICYEDQSINALVDQEVIPHASRVSQATNELKWLAENWFQRDSYARLEGQPVLLSFGYGGLNDDEWQSVFHHIDSPIRWMSEHTPRRGAFGAFDWPIPEKGLSQVRRFSEESKRWQCSIPVIFPRFVDVYKQAGVQASYTEIEDNNGETFRLSMDEAGRAHGQIVQIATWNDWGEGTQIEPSREFGYRDLECLQLLRQDQEDEQFQMSKASLRLPYRLLLLRRAGRGDDATLDQIARQMSRGKVKEARRMLESVELESVERDN